MVAAKHRQAGGTAGADIKALAAWDIQRDAPDVVVAILDTGLFLTHEDIVGNVWVNPGEQGRTAATPRPINVSARTQVGTDANILIAGFVIGGTGTKTVLLRAIGPTLGVFGVPGVLADPKLQLFTGSTFLQENDNWGTSTNAPQIAAAAAAVGAFPLALESKDAVLLLALPPGSYTAQVSGVGPAAVNTGAALVEVYEVP